jgi:hypothetical protein
MLSIEHIEDRIASLSEINHNMAVDCVLTYLQIGLTRCRIVRSRRDIFQENYSDGLEQAGAALTLAERIMWRIKPRHPEFDQMMAKVEQLKFELKSLTLNSLDPAAKKQSSPNRQDGDPSFQAHLDLPTTQTRWPRAHGEGSRDEEIDHPTPPREGI